MRGAHLRWSLLLAIPGFEALAAQQQRSRDARLGHSSLVRSEVLRTAAGSEEAAHAAEEKAGFLPREPQLMVGAFENSIARVSVSMWNKAAQEAPDYTVDDMRCTWDHMVWILVRDPGYSESPGDQKMLEQLKAASPICVAVLKLPKPPVNRNFWELKVVAVRDYILDHGSLQFVVSTDVYDVVLNPVTPDGLLSRFRTLTEGRAALVMSTEQTCWFGYICSATEALRWIQRLRNNTRRTDLTAFVNSQYMGERHAVLTFLDYALGAEPGKRGFPDKNHSDDQGMFAQAIAERPELVTMDWDEKIFASMARGMKPGVPGHIEFMCNFGGTNSTPCTWGTDWGDCTRNADGRVSVHEFQSGRNITPIIWHWNGPAPAAMSRTKSCFQSFLHNAQHPDRMLFRALLPSSSRMAMSDDVEPKTSVDRIRMPGPSIDSPEV